MRSYPFLQELFGSVLQKSKAIGGRFHVSTKGGLEINSDQLGEVLQDLVAPAVTQKYPLAIMMPPRAMSGYTDRKGEWERYRVTIFFFTGSYYNGANQIKSVNQNTQTSTHTILQDWHDMKRAAVDFLRVLSRVERDKGLVNSQFRLGQADKIIDPISTIGVDRVSGVRLDFSVSMFLGCDLEDYLDGDIAGITIPEEDSHPAHNQ